MAVGQVQRQEVVVLHKHWLEQIVRDKLGSGQVQRSQTRSILSQDLKCFSSKHIAFVTEVDFLESGKVIFDEIVTGSTSCSQLEQVLEGQVGQDFWQQDIVPA